MYALNMQTQQAEITTESAYLAIGTAAHAYMARHIPLSRGEGWSAVSIRAMDRALACCRGDYQRNLVQGYEAISGGTLKGKAATYGGKYAQSRAALVKRLQAEGLQVWEIIDGRRRGARILMISEVRL